MLLEVVVELILTVADGLFRSLGGDKGYGGTNVC